MAVAASMLTACYYMLRDLRTATGVPQGAVHSSWGGSQIRAWLSPEAGRVLYGEEQMALLDGYGTDPLAAVHDEFAELRKEAERTGRTDLLPLINQLEQAQSLIGEFTKVFDIVQQGQQMKRQRQEQRCKKPIIDPGHEKMRAGRRRWKRDETSGKKMVHHDRRDGLSAVRFVANFFGRGGGAGPGEIFRRHGTGRCRAGREMAGWRHVAQFHG